MFERFTERARHVVVMAQEQAKSFKHNYIGTEHLLLGLLAEEEGLAARVLGSLHLTLEAARNDLERMVGLGDDVAEGRVPFTPRCQKVLELALREALSLGHNYIGTEHILLGLVRENEGVGARILSERDVDSEKVRNEVIRLLSGPSGRRKPQIKTVEIDAAGEIMLLTQQRDDILAHVRVLIESLDDAWWVKAAAALNALKAACDVEGNRLKEIEEQMGALGFWEREDAHELAEEHSRLSRERRAA